MTIIDTECGEKAVFGALSEMLVENHSRICYHIDQRSNHKFAIHLVYRKNKSYPYVVHPLQMTIDLFAIFHNL